MKQCRRLDPPEKCVQFDPKRQPWPKGVVFIQDSEGGGVYAKRIENCSGLAFSDLKPGDWITKGLGGGESIIPDSRMKSDYIIIEVADEPCPRCGNTEPTP